MKVKYLCKARDRFASLGNLKQLRKFEKNDFQIFNFGQFMDISFQELKFQQQMIFNRLRFSVQPVYCNTHHYEIENNTTMHMHCRLMDNQRKDGEYPVEQLNCGRQILSTLHLEFRELILVLFANFIDICQLKKAATSIEHSRYLKRFMNTISSIDAPGRL